MQLQFHPQGLPTILVALVFSSLIFYFFPFLGLICFLVSGWILYFFRDPDRYVLQREGIVLSPADGVIQAIVPASLPSELGGDSGYTRVSIFLNIFNVHVNRIPISGHVLRSVYHPGKFFNASLDKASVDNERHSVLLEVILDGGKTVKIGFVQIAGLIARRIVNDIAEDTDVQVGQRFGIIKFGSRVDIYLPPSCLPQVGVGQIAVGGETILADLFTTQETSPPFLKV